MAGRNPMSTDEVAQQAAAADTDEDAYVMKHHICEHGSARGYARSRSRRTRPALFRLLRKDCVRPAASGTDLRASRDEGEFWSQPKPEGELPRIP